MRSGLLCVLLGSLAWGQAAPAGSPPAPAPPPMTARPAVPLAPADESASVAPTAAVLTIQGVCAVPKTSAAKGTAAKPAETKPAANADCKTVITKAEFEKLAEALAPNPNPEVKTVNPQVKRALETRLPHDLAMAEAAKKKGLENSSQYAQMMKFAKMSILAQLLQRQIQADAAKISDSDVQKYYDEHADNFEQFTVERLFVPRNPQIQNGPKDEEKGEKLSEEQQKAKQEAEKAKMEAGEQSMTKLADDLHVRAAAGEDFAKLQKEAFEASGMKIASPTITLPKLRRQGLPAAHAAVFDIKVGDVTAVINDAGGHYVYKLDAKDKMPLDQVKEEIHSKLQNDRSREMMEKINGSYKVETNEAYFGSGGPGMMPGMHPGMGSRMPMPPGAPARAQQAPARPAAPAAKIPANDSSDKQN